LVNWMSLLKACSQRIRGEVLGFFGSAEASLSFGVGAGGDVMKKIDLAAEKALTDTLEDHGISYTLISEEAGIRKIGAKPQEFYVTVDPVDGTTNAIRGLPFMATSIAVSKAPNLRDIEVALVSDLFHNVTYIAKRGYGAFRNEKKISPSKTSSLEEAVVGIDLNMFKLRGIAPSLVPVLEEAKHIRHLGANALEICYVADGTTDAFIDIREKLRTTDIAAAYLILREAGGIIVTPEGSEMNVPLAPTQRVSFIAAANTSIYERITELLTPIKH
jgi:myo-inositol-1(or 4)-monophosphatase